MVVADVDATDHDVGPSIEQGVHAQLDTICRESGCGVHHPASQFDPFDRHRIKSRYRLADPGSLPIRDDYLDVSKTCKSIRKGGQPGGFDSVVIGEEDEDHGCTLVPVAKGSRTFRRFPMPDSRFPIRASGIGHRVSDSPGTCDLLVTV